MNPQGQRTLQETITALSPAEVLAAAKRFFARHNSIYSAYLDREGPTFVALRGQGGEEVIIGVAPGDGGTRVTGSTYLFDQQVARFFATLPPAAQSAGVADPAPSAAPALPAGAGGPGNAPAAPSAS